jgi:hypothetical protein
MPTPTRLLLGTQRTPTNEQHCQASNNAAQRRPKRNLVQPPPPPGRRCRLLTLLRRQRDRNRAPGHRPPSQSPALPILKMTNLKSSSSSTPAPAAAVAVSAMDDRRRGRWASLSKSSPPQPEILKASSAAQQQQQHQTPPSCALGHSSHIKCKVDSLPLAALAQMTPTCTIPHSEPSRTPSFRQALRRVNSILLEIAY